jgi:23S rRNA (guanosine2251-2'-O)-methyltransferase
MDDLNNNFHEDKVLLFGIRAVIEAIKADKEIDKLFLQTNLNNELSRELMSHLKERNIPFQYVPVEKLNRLTRKNHQGVIGYLSSVTYQKIEDILPFLFEQGKVPLLLVLDRITDVRNFGAISRSAECAGVDAIIIPARGAAQVNADAIKTSAGALHKIAVCREDNLKQALDYIKASGVTIIACTEKAEQYHFDCDLTNPLAIIMGSEEDGISQEYLKRSDALVKIPMNGTISSLNVSVAAGVVLFEAIRQRMKDYNNID